MMRDDDLKYIDVVDDFKEACCNSAVDKCRGRRSRYLVPFGLVAAGTCLR